MKSEICVRTGGIRVSGLTDKIIEKLRNPYRLIAEWSAYLPLHVLLDMTEYDYHIERNPWSFVAHKRLEQMGIRDFTIPADLGERTRAYWYANWHPLTGIRPFLPEQCDNVFVVPESGRPMTDADYFDAVRAAII